MLCSVAMQHPASAGRLCAQEAWHASSDCWAGSCSGHGIMLQMKEKKHLLEVRLRYSGVSEGVEHMAENHSSASL